MVSSACWAILVNAAYLTFFVTRGSGSGVRIALLPWAVSAALLYLLSGLLFRRGIPLSLLIGIDTAVGVAAAVLVMLCCPGMHIVELLWAAGMVIGVMVEACVASITSPGLPNLISQTDISLLLTVWASFLACSDGGTISDLYPFLVSSLLLGACVLLLRTFGQSDRVLCGSPLRGGLLCGAMLAVIAFALLALLRFLSGGTRSAVDAVLHGSALVLSFLWQKCNAFMLWFVSLFPVQEEEPLEASASYAVSESRSEWMRTFFDWDRILPVFAGILAVAAAAAVIAAVLHFRGRRSFHLSVSRPAGSLSGRRSRRKGALRQHLDAFLFSLRFSLHFALHRSTPAGLQVWLENWGRRHRIPRLSGETCRSYFRRLAECGDLTCDRQELRAGLDRLSALLDLQYFGGEAQVLPRPLLRQIRRCFARAAAPEKADGDAETPL